VTLNILREAEDEIESARRYLNEQSSGLGGRFVSEVERALADVMP
jgi:hypothetical protein